MSRHHLLVLSDLLLFREGYLADEVTDVRRCFVQEVIASLPKRARALVSRLYSSSSGFEVIDMKQSSTQNLDSLESMKKLEM